MFLSMELIVGLELFFSQGSTHIWLACLTWTYGVLSQPSLNEQQTTVQGTLSYFAALLIAMTLE